MKTRLRFILSFIALIFVLSQSVKSQPLRIFSFCDSTTYNLNNDTNIIAGRYKLYLKNLFNTTLLHNFHNGNSDYFIRDFDIITPNLWYTVIGSRYIGDLTKLYKSTNKGLTWTQDTAYFLAIDSSLLGSNLGFNPFDQLYYKSINQIQKIGTDTLLIFLGYYMSGIVYSTNGGSTWNHWFGNMPAFYQGMFKCENLFYLFQSEGDGFAGRMFSFQKQFIFRNDSIVNFNHLPSGTGHHPDFIANNVPGVLYYTNVNWCTFFNTLSNNVNNQCSSTTFIPDTDEKKVAVSVFPNPSSNVLNVKINVENLKKNDMSIKLFDLFGNEVTESVILNENTTKIDISSLKSGLYFYKIDIEGVIFNLGKILVE